MKTIRGSDGTILNAAVLSADDVAHEQVMCPICADKVFTMWPEGWDAHAVHRCAGLDAGSAEARKAQYKTALRHLFRASPRGV